jgi:nitronate monooxygenase
VENQLTELLGMKYPIIQAPMAGGVTTSQLVAAVSNAGGLGMIGAGYLSPDQMRKQINEIRELTTENFGINLFVPSQFKAAKNEVQTAVDAMKSFKHELDLDDELPELPTYEAELEKFNEQIRIVIEEKVPVCSFTFGIPSADTVSQLRSENIILVGTATTVKEAILNEKAGMDAITVQGSEAGGHRGTFTEEDGSLIGLMSLIPQAADHVHIPIIAAGGIMDARGLAASLCLGAQAVQMGTAFLTCVESGAADVHKQAILEAADDQIVFTRAFSGKNARGIKNRFITEMREVEQQLPDFPVQNTLTKGIRGKASVQKNKEFMSLWSGQSPMLAKSETVEELINRVVMDAKKLKDFG